MTGWRHLPFSVWEFRLLKTSFYWLYQLFNRFPCICTSVRAAKHASSTAWTVTAWHVQTLTFFICRVTTVRLFRNGSFLPNSLHVISIRCFSTNITYHLWWYLSYIMDIVNLSRVILIIHFFFQNDLNILGIDLNISPCYNTNCWNSQWQITYVYNIFR